MFRHKWKISLCFLLGVSGAGALVYREIKFPVFTSQAKLLVRYVLERSAVDPYESKADPSGTRGMAVMDAEIEIIKSRDLAMTVARKIGPAKILTSGKGPPLDSTAALEISKYLEVSASRGSNVIHLAYRHPNPEVTVGVLKQLIESYFEKHLEIHRSTGAFENVARETDKARSQLSQTEAELAKLSAEYGLLSFTDSRNSLESRRNEMRSALSAARIELAQQKARVASLAAGSGSAADGAANKETERTKSEPEPETIGRLKARQKYLDLAEQLTLFKQRRNALLMSRKPGDPTLEALDRQIATIQQQGLDLLERFPGLAGLAKAQGSPSSNAPSTDITAEKAAQDALETKTAMLAEQLAKLDEEAGKLASRSSTFANLERRRQLEEEKYRYYESSLEKARVDEALNPASMPNIGVVQSPSSPTKPIPATVIQLGSGLIAGGLLAGLGLAFLSEWVIGRRVSRPIEIQTRLQLPLMMSIPRIRSKDGLQALMERPLDHAESGNTAGLITHHESGSDGTGGRAAEKEHFITPYAGAIRDRIMFGFEVNNITHKPKLIGLTSLTHGAGTTTIAVAMARAFAENGRFKVLLVDLNCALTGIPAETPVIPLETALEQSRAHDFRLQPGSLYYATAPTRISVRSGHSLASVEMHELMPKLVLSDYDYIVFDMPPVSPTSPTAALAGFMDKLLLVLDAENTNRENLSWSFAELEKGNADVSCVFNKAKSIAPRWAGGEG